ncbi:SUR7/PalI family-domain-containing protein [Xylaria sp. CBS 124048]|nr:SUR7/PalI family-domain-containing protein [Xylaria sp. CBS 124048]
MARLSNFAPLSLPFLAGSIVLLFFVVLSGITSSPPFHQTYFLSADTTNITGARPVSQWTYFRICGEDNSNCSAAWPDPPIGWAWSKDPTGPNLPTKLIGAYGDGTTSYVYFYLWRFGWVLYLLALFATILAFFIGFAAVINRVRAYIAALVSAISLLLLTFAASLMTATFVRMRDQFIAAGREAHIGVYAFGFTWAAWVLALASFVLLFLLARTRVVTRMRRNQSVRSRPSHDVGGHRIKEEYA